MTAEQILGLFGFALVIIYTGLMVRDWRHRIERRRAERLIARMEARP